MEPETLLGLPEGAGGPQFSPDGARLAYTEAGLVLVRRLTGTAAPRDLGPGGAPRWQPDGAALTVLRSDDGRPRVWRLRLGRAGPATPLTPAGLAVADYAWAPNGAALAVLEAAPLRRDPATGRLPEPRPSAVWLAEPATGEARRLAEVPPGEWPARLSWAPDGGHLAWDVLALADERSGEATPYEVRRLALTSLAGGSAGDPAEPERPARRVVPLGTCQTRRAVWRPDGRALALLATPDPHGYPVRWGLATWPLAGRSAARWLTRDPLVAHGAAWAPDGQTVYVAGRRRGVAEHLYAVPAGPDADAGGPGGAPPRRLTHGLAHHGVPVVSPDGRWLACDVAAPDRLSEVWLVAADGTAARPVTDGARALRAVTGLRLGAPALVRWRAADGLELEGLLVYPPPYGPDRPPPGPLPTVVDLHGGPYDTPPWRRLGDHALYGTGLHYLAAHGYLAFGADYRGSGLYGWAHVRRALDRGECPGQDATDVLAGVDHLVASGLADPARLGLRGFSHGGYLANWLVCQTGRFRAAVSCEGVVDFALAPELDPGAALTTVRFGGTPAEVPARYRRAAPLALADQARTPTLLLEGAHSPLARAGQGAAFREALRAAGVEAEYVCYPGEGHLLTRPEHQADYLRRTLAWFDRHLRRAG